MFLINISSFLKPYFYPLTACRFFQRAYFLSLWNIPVQKPWVTIVPQVGTSRFGFQTQHLRCCCNSVTSFLSVLEKSWNHSFWILTQTSQIFHIFFVSLLNLRIFSITPCSICPQAAGFLQNWRIKKVHWKTTTIFHFFLHPQLHN